MLSNLPHHIRLLNLLAAIRDLSPFDLMTAEEDELLRLLIVRWHTADNITVSEIMKSLVKASETTVYRRLMALRSKGMIHLRLDEADRRVKFVEPTSVSEQYAQYISAGFR